MLGRGAAAPVGLYFCAPTEAGLRALEGWWRLLVQRTLEEPPENSAEPEAREETGQ
jgi:hypothetical protein